MKDPDWRKWRKRKLLDHWRDDQGRHWWIGLVGGVAVTYEATDRGWDAYEFPFPPRQA